MAALTKSNIRIAVPTPKAPAPSVLLLRALPIAEKIIKEHEGFRSEPYDDATGKPLKGGTPKGFATIGYGFTERMRKGITKRASISESEASQILRDELLGKYGAPIQAAVKASLSPAQFAVLLSLSWNAGATAVVNSDVLKLLNAGKVKEAATRLRTWYVTSKGKKMPGLVKRRDAEAKLLLQEETSTSSALTAIPMRIFRAAPVASLGVVSVAAAVILLIAWKAAQKQQSLAKSLA
jgi:GH24 family phage-related lysozyme (muramidase)